MSLILYIVGLIGATLQLELHSGQDFVCKDTPLPHHHVPTNKKDAGTEERKQSSEGNLTALVQLTVDEKILEQLNRKENINIVIKKKDLTQVRN